MTSPPDPLATLPAWRIALLARRAERARRRGPQAVVGLAARVGLDSDQLLLLADAWSEGGHSGIAALGPAPPFPDDVELRLGHQALETWRRAQPTATALRWDVWRNRATLWQADLAVVHLRLTSGGRWHLYRKLESGEWWPAVVNGRRRPQSLADCLAALPLDPENGGRQEHRGGDRRPDGVG